MIWRDFLTPDEVARLEQLKADTRAIKAEHRRIYDRCRKRMERLEQTAPIQTDLQTDAKS